MGKLGRALGALTAVRNNFIEGEDKDADNPMKRAPPDFITRQEAEKRAAALVDKIAGIMPRWWRKRSGSALVPAAGVS